MCKYYGWSSYNHAICKADGNNWISGSKETREYCASQDNCVQKLKNKEIADKMKISDNIKKLRAR